MHHEKAKITVSKEAKAGISAKAKEIQTDLSLVLEGLVHPKDQKSMEIDLLGLVQSIRDLSELYVKIQKLTSADDDERIKSSSPLSQKQIDLYLTPISEITFADTTSTQGQRLQNRCMVVLHKLCAKKLGLSYRGRIYEVAKYDRPPYLAEIAQLTAEEVLRPSESYNNIVHCVERALEEYGLALGTNLSSYERKILRQNGCRLKEDFDKWS